MKDIAWLKQQIARAESVTECQLVVSLFLSQNAEHARPASPTLRVPVCDVKRRRGFQKSPYKTRF